MSKPLLHMANPIPSSPMNRNVLNVETHQFLLILRGRPWEEQALIFPFVSKEETIFAQGCVLIDILNTTSNIQVGWLSFQSLQIR